MPGLKQIAKQKTNTIITAVKQDACFSLASREAGVVTDRITAHSRPTNRCTGVSLPFSCRRQIVFAYIAEIYSIDCLTFYTDHRSDATRLQVAAPEPLQSA